MTEFLQNVPIEAQREVHKFLDSYTLASLRLAQKKVKESVDMTYWKRYLKELLLDLHLPLELGATDLYKPNYAYDAYYVIRTLSDYKDSPKIDAIKQREIINIVYPCLSELIQALPRNTLLQYFLGLYLVDKKFSDDTVDIQRGLRYLQAAANQGFIPAMLLAANTFYNHALALHDNPKEKVYAFLQQAFIAAAQQKGESLTLTEKDIQALGYDKINYLISSQLYGYRVLQCFSLAEIKGFKNTKIIAYLTWGRHNLVRDQVSASNISLLHPRIVYLLTSYEDDINSHFAFKLWEYFQRDIKVLFEKKSLLMQLSQTNEVKSQLLNHFNHDLESLIHTSPQKVSELIKAFQLTHLTKRPYPSGVEDTPRKSSRLRL